MCCSYSFGWGAYISSIIHAKKEVGLLCFMKRWNELHHTQTNESTGFRVKIHLSKFNMITYRPYKGTQTIENHAIRERDTHAYEGERSKCDCDNSCNCINTV